MQELDEFLAELRFFAFDDFINTVEVIGGFDDIVYLHPFLGDGDGVGFKDKARLLVGLTALFLFENIRQSLLRGFAFIAPFGLLGIFGVLASAVICCYLPLNSAKCGFYNLTQNAFALTGTWVRNPPSLWKNDLLM